MTMIDGWPVWWSLGLPRLLTALVVVFVGGRLIIHMVRTISRPPDAAPPAPRPVRVAPLSGRVLIVPGRPADGDAPPDIAAGA